MARRASGQERNQEDQHGSDFPLRSHVRHQNPFHDGGPGSFPTGELVPVVVNPAALYVASAVHAVPADYADRPARTPYPPNFPISGLIVRVMLTKGETSA